MVSRQMPEIYESRNIHDSVMISKTGSMSPEMAAANYENLSKEEPGQEQSRGMGMGV